VLEQTMLFLEHQLPSITHEFYHELSVVLALSNSWSIRGQFVIIRVRTNNAFSWTSITINYPRILSWIISCACLV